MPFSNNVHLLHLQFVRRPGRAGSEEVRKYLTAAPCRILFIATFLLLAIFCRTVPAISAGARPVAPLSEIKAIITEKSLHPPSPAFLANLGMDHLAKRLRSFDTHARYLPPATPSRQKVPSLRLGLDVFAYNSRIWIRPEPGGPADRQGVPEICQLRKINNIRLPGELEQASSIIDSEISKNTVFLDTYDERNGLEKQYTVQPASFRSSSVTVRTVGRYAFIRIVEFVAHETAPFFLGLYRTKEEAGARIIIDLRGCPGGDLFEALEIAGMFVPAGLPLVSTFDRIKRIHSYLSPTGEKLSKPVGILIDKRTASAAEIMAGVLEKNSITRLIGERSYGKCESQTVFDLSNGGQLWLTTLSIHFADDASCTGKGIQPDVLYPDISVAAAEEITTALTKN